MKSTRTRHSAAFKAELALAAIREQAPVLELGRRHGVHANQIYKWKKQFLDHAALVFERTAQTNESERERELRRKLEELRAERDFLWFGLGRRR